MLIVNGIADGLIDPRDRGFTYGDGVFRTLPMRDGAVPHWQHHYRKLAADCAALHLACPPQDVLEADIAQIRARQRDGVIRITVTRGVAERGYVCPDKPVITRVVAWSAIKPLPQAAIRARWCSLRLTIQPALAGIKHLNRLENVLARAEWSDPQTGEGLLCDALGRVIGGTMSNLFLLRNGALSTPSLDGSGVAGVTREIIIEKARAEQFTVDIAEITPDMVHSADAVFLVNSVIGVWQVISLGESKWKDAPFMERVRGWIAHG